jgi:SAM-dependent methyltransferase
MHDLRWDCGPSWVESRRGKVVGWYNSPDRTLRVKDAAASYADTAMPYAVPCDRLHQVIDTKTRRMPVLSRAVTSLRKARRRLWLKYALRGADGSDRFERLDLLYTVKDPWNMASEKERARFEATNRVIEGAFGRVGSVLELGCGEGHQTEYLAKISNTQYGVDVSAQAVERARKRLPQAQFESTDVFG